MDPHLAYEIAGIALNLLINRKYAKKLLAATNPAELCGEVIRPLLKTIPIQTRRSGEQVRRQQFSPPPPPIVYLVIYLMNFKVGGKILEPSDGTRSLSVWASGAEILLEVHTNEIDERRSVLHESRLPLSIALLLELDFGLIMGKGGGVIGSSAMSIKRALNTAGTI